MRSKRSSLGVWGSCSCKPACVASRGTETSRIWLKRRDGAEATAARAVPAVRQEDTAGIRRQGRFSGGPGASTLPVGIGGSVSAWSTGIGVSLQIR